MEPVALALASNEHYFPGLYCAVTSALCHLDPAREADVRVIDGGISDKSRGILSDLVGRFGRKCRLAFGDLSELFDLELLPGKVLGAVPDSETLSIAEDSPHMADAANPGAEGAYFNCGVMLLNLERLRNEHFSESAIEVLDRRRGQYRFWDQSAINFLLHEQIHELPQYWNRSSWRFDTQKNNDLECVLHYTTSAPWLGGTPGPAQVLFERFAADAGSPVNRQIAAFKKSRQQFFRNVLAPFRALAFLVVSFFYKIAGQEEKCAGYQKAA